MSRRVCPHPSEYCVTGRVTDMQERKRVHSQGQTPVWHAREPGLSQDRATVWHARDPASVQRIRQLTDMQGIQGSFRGSDNWLTRKRARVVTGSGNCLTCKGSSVSAEDQTTDWHATEPGFIHRVRQLTDMLGLKGSFRGSDNWLTCKEAEVDSQSQATNIKESWCSVRCQAADWHARQPVFSTVSGSWPTYKRASVQYGARQLTDIQESQCSIRCQAADWRARQPVFSTVSGSSLACKKPRVHSQGKATDTYESQVSVQGQAHRSSECGTSIVLGSGFRSQPKDRLCWFGFFVIVFSLTWHVATEPRTGSWPLPLQFVVHD